jgi:hypothetical protein
MNYTDTGAATKRRRLERRMEAVCLQILYC